MENQIDILKKVSNTVLQEPVEITVDISAQNWLHGKLQKIKWLSKWFPRKKAFLIHPIKMGSLARISKLLLSIDKKLFENSNLLEINYKAVEQHHGTLALIIALAIHNKKSEPSGKLVQLIIDHFTPQEVFAVLVIVLKQMDVTSFMSSIISVRGLNITEMSPQEQGSSIAPGTSSEV